MLASNIELVKHILDEINFILQQTYSKSKEQATLDPVLSRALIRSLEIIGEASSKLDQEFRSLHPHIEWRKITNTRNKLIHEYFGVDYDIVWDIITNKLPNLKVFLEEIIF
ncbi:HepT-like ribonuclease domain-containing protein [Pedobacter agri]|uniref:DUF86 domain-containing protein n=1 Tax=Pedobacter agri TaxID=454586 RepID=A0A9X3DC80_9SPHI|nr:HepT-like ribonuclease domain-containing protein [Pedobacter agri]MCX3263460.1 DUF86 domain-containing protein [Pedobacter agri]